PRTRWALRASESRATRARCGRTCASAPRLRPRGPRRRSRSRRLRAGVEDLGAGLMAPFERQREAKRRAPVRALGDPDAPAVGADDAAADREAEPDPPALAFAHAVELLEHALGVLAIDARPAVGDLDLDLALERPRGDVDRRARRRVLRRVLDEVDEHLLDEDRVERHERQVAREVGADRPAAEPVVEAVERGAHDLFDRLGLLFYRPAAVPEARGRSLIGAKSRLPRSPVLRALRGRSASRARRRGPAGSRSTAWPSGRSGK